MINKTCSMQRIIKNRPIQTKVEREEGDEDWFRRMGGKGGMGAFSSLSSIDGMGDFGGTMRGMMGFNRR